MFAKVRRSLHDRTAKNEAIENGRKMCVAGGQKGRRERRREIERQAGRRWTGG